MTIITFGKLIYYLAIMMFMSGIYIMMTSSNLMRKIIGLGIFQNSILVFYVALGKFAGGRVPIVGESYILNYSSPLPHVLMLTAIVVGFATLSVGLALIVRISEKFASVNEDDIIASVGEDE
jgi:multicomponent Na+:H+ antiporter subunit C